MAKESKFVQLDGTPKIYVSSRQGNSRLYYTSEFDDIANGTRGGGPSLLFRNTNAEQQMTIEGQFLDDIYLKDGYLMWEKAAVGDSVSMEIILPANQPMPKPERDGNYDLVDGSLVPNTEGTGGFIMNPVDFIIDRFVNKVLILGTNTTGFIMISSDTTILPNIFKVKTTVDSPTGNVNLNVVVSLETYREHTV